jgi:hypothetical protein
MTGTSPRQTPAGQIPRDDPARRLAAASPARDQSLEHLGVPRGAAGLLPRDRRTASPPHAGATPARHGRPGGVRGQRHGSRAKYGTELLLGPSET